MHLVLVSSRFKTHPAGVGTMREALHLWASWRVCYSQHLVLPQGLLVFMSSQTPIPYTKRSCFSHSKASAFKSPWQSLTPSSAQTLTPTLNQYTASALTANQADVSAHSTLRQLTAVSQLSKIPRYRRISPPSQPHKPVQPAQVVLPHQSHLDFPQPPQPPKRARIPPQPRQSPSPSQLSQTPQLPLYNQSPQSPPSHRPTQIPQPPLLLQTVQPAQSTQRHQLRQTFQIPRPAHLSQPCSTHIITPSLPNDPTSPSTQPSQNAERGILTGAHHNIFNNAQFIQDNSTNNRPSGLNLLFQHAMPDAFHNSAARYPHPNVTWSDIKDNMLWMRGSFGIGKTAIAQSCTEVLESQRKLIAAMFLSRANADRNDPRQFFPSLAYQIATQCPALGDIIAARIIQDPALSTKTLAKQFEDLLARPLIIDGLDECRGTIEQCEIIKIIADSVRNRTTPFRWFITSRPEDHITRTMHSKDIASVSTQFELPVSRNIDHEILLYLTDELGKTRESHALPKTWLTEEALALLVERAGGLWIYISTIVRFINDGNSFGPEDQLRIVIEFAQDLGAKSELDNPLEELDSLYRLIVAQIPARMNQTIRKILLLDHLKDFCTPDIAAVLGLDEKQFLHCCSSIRSVVEVWSARYNSLYMNFYHASFLDFMFDTKRSKELCVLHGRDGYLRELLGWLGEVYSRSTGTLIPDKFHHYAHISQVDSEEFPELILPSKPPLVEGIGGGEYYVLVLNFLWSLCSEINLHPMDVETAMLFERLPFQKMFKLLPDEVDPMRWGFDVHKIRSCIPVEFRDKIVRLGKCPVAGCLNRDNVVILGSGDNETVAPTYHPNFPGVFELRKTPVRNFM
ncbi:hypothetical protein NP233_g10583 [Leucocoprinus birnbaumii]|uniref:Nephrocystin 3-like N-terminal domain-containing protein n=1 Tax=Leucocoprinus birnbaumii TaxID=56174 RepID=A0AAD5VI73_9AGAR|nr:hypothetical protein NP233_g10583 [Leucocoprinus birnbaumii]